jgi:hypothetical protein
MHVLNPFATAFKGPIQSLGVVLWRAGLCIRLELPFVFISANSAALPDHFELNDLVAVAVTQSPAVKSSQSSLQASVAANGEADWSRYPSIGLVTVGC